MRFTLGKTEEGKSCCPHCKTEAVKLVYVARLITKEKLVEAYRCTQCKRIIWLKD